MDEGKAAHPSATTQKRRAVTAKAQKPLLDGKTQILRAIVDFGAGEGSVDAHAMLRVWRTLSSAEHQVACNG